MSDPLAGVRVWLAALAAVPIVALPVAAQDAALRELAEAVVGAELLVGELPAGSVVADVIPADARVIGSLERGRSLTVILAVPGDPLAAERRVRETFRARGWTSPEAAQQPPGFVTSGFASLDVLCRDDSYVTVDPAPLPGGETRIRLNVSRRTGSSPCDARMPRHGMDSPIPTLTPPAGVRSTGGGMSSGSDGEFQAEAFLETALDAGEIAAHYGRQTEREGWEPTTEREDNVVALRTYTKVDTDGQRLHGMLLIVAPPGVGGRMAIFRVTPLTGRSR